MIEVFFRVLKSGCRVEERLFEHMDRLLTCLALYMIVAWRTLYVCRLGGGGLGDGRDFGLLVGRRKTVARSCGALSAWNGLARHVVEGAE